MEKRMHWLILCAILVIATFFRFYNLNWDKGQNFHPDERNIALAVTRIHFFSQMNPEFFAYGSLPMYMYRFAANGVVKITGDQDWIQDWGKINLVGRHFSAFFSSLTILLVYLLGRKILSPTAGLIASWFTAMTPFLIQQAHFAITESMLAFWAVLLTFKSLSMLSKPTFSRMISLGVLFAAAVATKVSAISLGIIPLCALLFGDMPKKKRSSTNLSKRG